jgi:[ribosomal protein S18]-alanine N-acetyltransferase
MDGVSSRGRLAGIGTIVSALQIREMVVADIPIVASLERVVYPQPWSMRVFYDELALDSRTYIVAESDGRIVAYAGLLIVAEDAHVTTVAVDPEARKRRVGTHLMVNLVDRALLAGARHLTLEVRVSNDPARQLYERFGFSPVGLRKNYYRDEDALVMWAIDIDTDDYAARLSAIRTSLEEAA